MKTFKIRTNTPFEILIKSHGIITHNQEVYLLPKQIQFKKVGKNLVLVSEDIDVIKKHSTPIQLFLNKKSGYSIQLELHGVGLRIIEFKDQKIYINLGYTNITVINVPDNFHITPTDDTLSIYHSDLQKLTQFVAQIKTLRKTDPYKGTGFRITGDKIQLKQGKDDSF